MCRAGNQSVEIQYASRQDQCRSSSAETLPAVPITFRLSGAATVPLVGPSGHPGTHSLMAHRKFTTATDATELSI